MSFSNIETINFEKMQGAGNDFVVFDNREMDVSKEEIIERTPELCDRKFGIGADGILVLFPAEHSDVDYTMFYRNPDGSDAGMCGNGARCMALFAQKCGFGAEQTFNVHDEVYRANVQDKENVTVSFPITASVRQLSIENQTLYQIYTGTEHLVLLKDDKVLEDKDFLKEQGSFFRYHGKFQPEGTNVNFISGINTSSLKLQTYERGVENLTLACGTGAIASALVWHHLQKDAEAPQSQSVKTKGGILRVRFSFDEQTQSYKNIELEGPAHFVFKGKI